MAVVCFLDWELECLELMMLILMLMIIRVVKTERCAGSYNYLNSGSFKDALMDPSAMAYLPSDDGDEALRWSRIR